MSLSFSFVKFSVTKQIDNNKKNDLLKHFISVSNNIMVGVKGQHVRFSHSADMCPGLHIFVHVQLFLEHVFVELRDFRQPDPAAVLLQELFDAILNRLNFRAVNRPILS